MVDVSLYRAELRVKFVERTVSHVCRSGFVSFDLDLMNLVYRTTETIQKKLLLNFCGIHVD